MESSTQALRVLSNKTVKYDVLYVNTPWSTLSLDDLQQLPVNKIVGDSAALFIWTDAYSAAKATKLIEKWGFTFHSVFQIMDIASYPWMANKPKEIKKPRAPLIYPPSWWSSPTETNYPSRPSTEQLWLAIRGDASEYFNDTTTAFNVVNLPDLGKKPSASKRKKQEEAAQSVTLGCGADRPSVFLENMMSHLKPEVRILNLFTTTLHNHVDSWGPMVPGGFLTGLEKNSGLVGKINEIMQSMKKKDLKLLSSGQQKTPVSDSIFEIIESFKGPMTYDLKDKDGKIQDWVFVLLRTMAKKKLEQSRGSQKKKRKSRSNDEPTPRHGIASAAPVSKEMAEFLGIPLDEKIARTTVVSRLNEYIAKNNLQNPAKKVEIILDEPLRKLLNPPADFGTVTYFNLCKLVGIHFPKQAK